MKLPDLMVQAAIQAAPEETIGVAAQHVRGRAVSR